MNADRRRCFSDVPTAVGAPSATVDELNAITEKVIGAAFRVSNELGCGFLEKVYENAMAVALAESGIRFRQQAAITVSYHGRVIGEYVADLLVEDRVLVELKAVKALDEVHAAQCMNYLKATGLQVCLLLNFGCPRMQLKRIVNQLMEP